jgi:hypothetical protein
MFQQYPVIIPSQQKCSENIPLTLQCVAIGMTKDYVRNVDAIKKDLRIGMAINALMREKKMKPKDVMRLTGFTRTTLWRHMNGETEPDLEARERYASAFRISIDDFEARWQAIPIGEARRVAAKPPGQQSDS